MCVSPCSLKAYPAFYQPNQPTLCRVTRKCATSAVAGGYGLKSVALGRNSVTVKAAHRNDVDKTEGLSPVPNGACDATTPLGSLEACRTSDESRSPLAFSSASLPVLACNPKNPSACLNIRSINDPCLDDSLDLKVFEYLEHMVVTGMTEQRAAKVIEQWSGGGGVGMVDLRKLRLYFLRTTLESVIWQQLPSVAAFWTVTGMAYWSLGQLPAADDALLHPALRGALVAVNLLLLVFFASGSLKRGGRIFRIGRAAYDFSSRAELVLLALEDLAKGHGSLIRAVRGQSASPGAGTSGPYVRPQRSTLASVHRRSARQRVLNACSRVMVYVKGQQKLPAVPLQPLREYDTRRTATATPANGSSYTASPLGSLYSFLLLQEAAKVLGRTDGGDDADAGFDPMAELGLSSDEAAAAASMYARYGDSLSGGRIGDYELRRLLQEAGVEPLSEDERRLAMAAVSTGGRPWLSFRDWARWWAASPSANAPAADTQEE